MRFNLAFLLLILATSISGRSQGFVENKGQWPHPFLYRCEIPGGALFLKENAFTFHLVDRSDMHAKHDGKPVEHANPLSHHHAFNIRFVGANLSPHIVSNEPYSNYLNYYIGNDPSRWKNNIHPAGKIIYEELYPGIDLWVQQNNSTLKYEFHVKPYADPSQIRLSFEGTNGLELDRHGNLLIHTTVMDMKELKPEIYQHAKASKKTVEGGFVIAGNTVSYTISNYDSSNTLVIDPILLFSTYSGSTADNWGFTATPDKKGFLYSGSIAFETGYPTTTGAFDQSFNGGEEDIVITKYDTTGSLLIYSTYVGGSEVEFPHSLIVDNNDNLYVFGTTGSDNFPTTSGAFDRSFNGGAAIDLDDFQLSMPDGADMFVARFNATGSALSASTYLGGAGRDGLNINTELRYNYADELRGEINIDLSGDVYVVSSTTSDGFPGTAGNFQPQRSGAQDGIIVKLNPSLSTILWSSYLGGSGNDAAYGIDFDRNGNPYVCGGTASNNFPVTANTYQGFYNSGRCDGYIARIRKDGKVILNSTYFGSTSYDQMYLIQVDNHDEPHVFGQTENNSNHFIFNAAFNNIGGGQVLGHFRPDLKTRVWTTQFGSTPGRPNISPTSFLVDVCNSVYVAGWGGFVNQSVSGNNASTVDGLPVSNDAFQSSPDSEGSDFYLAVITSDGNALTYGTFYGGSESAEHVDGGTSRFDRSGKIYQCVCAGCGGSNDFPTFPDSVWSDTNGSSNCNSAVFKFDFNRLLIIADFDVPAFGCAPFTVTFDNQSEIQSATSYAWLISNGQTFSTANPTYTFTEPGTYTIRLIIDDPTSCNLRDTAFRTIVIKKDTSFALPDVVVCFREPAALGPDPNTYDPGNGNISWSPAGPLNNAGILNPTANVNDTTNFLLTVSFDGCSERISQRVIVLKYPIEASSDTIVCSTFSPFEISATAFGEPVTYYWSRDPNFGSIISTDSVLTVSNLSDPLNFFYVRTTRADGCSMWDTVMVTVSDYDLYLTPDTFTCMNDSFTLTALSENPLNTFYYYWTLESLQQNPDAELLTDTTSNFLGIQLDAIETFHLFATSRVVDGCNVRDSVTVQVSALDRSLVNATPEEYVFYYGESVSLKGEPSEGFDVEWTPGEFLSDSASAAPSAKPKKEMTYVFTSTDPEFPECTASDTVHLIPYKMLCGEPEVYLPNTFTPNGDGLNDQLFIQGKNINTVDLSIYDRWGKLMYHTQDKNQGWDAYVNGELVEPAVYVYYYELTCLDGQYIFRKGNVTVLR